MIRTGKLGVLVLAALALAGCGTTSTASPPSPSAGAVTGNLTVFAAASLTETFTQLGKDFEAAHPGVKVTFSFGGSSALAQQITAGAPADVFASAAPANLKQVADAHLVAGQSATFARNTLQIAVPKGNPGHVTGLADLTGPGVKLALCAEQVPCGAAAKKAFQTANQTPHPVTLEQDVKATLTKLELGEVDAAVVYRTDVAAAAGKVTGVDFPEAASAVNDYPIAALSGSHNPTAATAFVQYVLSQPARDVLTRAGFSTP